MIRRLSYTACDKCGDPAQPADDAREARAIAKREGFVRRDGEDLCPRCAGRAGYLDEISGWVDLPEGGEGRG